MKKKRPGWIWKNGYWSKIDDKAKHKEKRPFFCPFEGDKEKKLESCRRPTSNLDDPYLLEYGICKRCYIMFVEDRETPLVDTDFYAKRLKDRGY